MSSLSATDAGDVQDNLSNQHIIHKNNRALWLPDKISGTC